MHIRWTNFSIRWNIICVIQFNPVKNYIQGCIINLQGTSNRWIRASSVTPYNGYELTSVSMIIITSMSRSSWRCMNCVCASRIFSCISSEVWNNLPPDIIDALMSNWVTCFKSYLMKHLSCLYRQSFFKQRSHDFSTHTIRTTYV